MRLVWVLLRAVAVLLALGVSGIHATEDTIKVGILHSLSGTMAISKSVLKDTVLMMIADQNRKGGLLGKKLEPVVVDPASNWDAFAGKGPRVAHEGEGRGRIRLLDVGVPKVGSAALSN